jgi:pimeloyl-ACP methyl ester carboxylesterase
LHQNEPDPGKSTSDDFAQTVLGLVNAELKRDVLAPFQDEETTMAYARQLIEFVAYDALADAARVRIPVLLIASEYDKISSPGMSHLATAMLPNARCIQLRGASHYSLYDRAETVAGFMATFFDDPALLPGERGEVVEFA